jgi:phytoene synthase
MIARIRIAWWRERLEELDAGEATPGEPRLEAARTEILSRGISGHDLAGLADGWERMLDPFPWGVETSEGIWFRGLRAFGLGARILGHSDEKLQQAGAMWALVDAARHCSDAETRRLLIERARTIAKGLKGTKVDRRLRPLSMLAALAMRDLKRGEPFEPEGTPGRALAMVRHRLIGRL